MSQSDKTTVMNRPQPDDYVRLSAHPRATRSIARTKAVGGVVGFLTGFWLASKAGLPSWDVGVRALAGGIAGYVLLWLFAVTFWRQYAMAEYHAAQRRRAERIRAHNERVREMQAERAEALRAAREPAS